MIALAFLSFLFAVRAT